uniref:ubiquitinyl hydrolase 1 n=1 Tax=Dicentrarchus labrax TaxID=13489 RepID=A0A8C4EXE0_DICLA
MLINQLKEITGIQDPQVLYRAMNASQGDIGHAVGLLTTQPAEVQDPGEPQELETSGEAWEGQKGTLGTKKQTYIHISLSVQRFHPDNLVLCRALEASAEENAARMKRKRCEAQSETCSPADWIRQDDWPVGIRNVGNTCWFSAVIQSLFHLPVFRRLVLNYHLSERLLEKCKSHSDKRNIAFMQELRCLFALMVGSTRRFVDPSAAVELLRDAFRTSEAQQDVSEFSHKLLDWLEDAFQLAANGSNAEDKQQNPMVQLFYGTFVTERRHEGKTLCNIEQFGQYPLQVNGFNNLDECLEGAMVEKEIESLHSDHSVTSGRERWFKTLPPVLTFELSRFEFNTQLGRPEKIHKKLEFPQIVYMDRYLHKNIEQTHERRGEVKKLKEQLAALQQKLECYKNYGSGPTKYPLADMLQFVLEFATTKPTSVSPAEDLRPTSPSPTPASHPLSDPTSKDNSIFHLNKSFIASCFSKPASLTPSIISFSLINIKPNLSLMPFLLPSCRLPIDCPPHPAPHSITEEELHFVKTCLQRWRTEVENDINELKASIDRLSQTLEVMYSDNTLCQVPYRLHAVLVHEGQASAGHYWAYIYDHANQRWMKYNDVSITESSWEELERDSFGGMTNASAYCLMYIDDRLPNLITGMSLRYVHEDNRWFQQELSEWEEQFCQAATPQGESTASAEPPNPSPDDAHQTEVEPAPQSGPSTEELNQGASSEPQPDTEAEKDPEPDPREGPHVSHQHHSAQNSKLILFAFHEEYSRLYELSKEETTLQEDARLQHSLVYFFQNKAPNRIIERTLLEQFTDRNLSFDERAISIMREARSKLRLIKPEDMDMDEYLQWHDDYRLFRTVFVYLLTGLEHYQHGKMREALIYLAHAYETNTTLLKNGEKRGVDKSVIAGYRRRCLTALNESASRLFCSGEETNVEEGVAIMDEAVIPCLHLMSRDSTLSQEDRDAMESIRSHWCCCLGQDMDDSLQVKLGEFLPRVLDGSAETVVLKDPPKVHVNQAHHDLCSRLAAVMESIHNTSIVTVK